MSGGTIVFILYIALFAALLISMFKRVRKQKEILKDFSQSLDGISKISELAETNQKKTRELLLAAVAKAQLNADDEFTQQVTKTLNELGENKDKIVAECQTLALKISEDLKKNPALDNLKIEVTRK